MHPWYERLTLLGHYKKRYIRPTQPQKYCQIAEVCSLQKYLAGKKTSSRLSASYFFHRRNRENGRSRIFVREKPVGSRSWQGAVNIGASSLGNKDLFWRVNLMFYPEKYPRTARPDHYDPNDVWPHHSHQVMSQTGCKTRKECLGLSSYRSRLRRERN